MPSASLDFASLGSGHESLGGAAPVVQNVTVDATGTVRRRPGIQYSSLAPDTAIESNPVDGLYVTTGGGAYAVAGSGSTRNIYRLSDSTANLLGSSSGGLRASFAETEALLVYTTGLTTRKVDLATDVLADLGGSPPTSSHVIFNASRLLANDRLVDRSKIRFSDPAAGTVTTGHETWQYGGSGTSGFFSAEARPDPVVALGENSNEVFVWGSTNLEVYAPDPLFTFGRVVNRDYGCSAPYSIVRYDQNFCWLDHRRRFIMSNGRQSQEISEAIGPILDSLSKVSDCYGYRVSEGTTDAMVWTFPTAGTTFCYQVGGGWSTWNSYASGQQTAFPVTSSSHDPTTNVNLVGLSTGVVAQMSADVSDDLGTNIVAYAETGFMSHGTSGRKTNKLLHVTLRRGTTTASEEPAAFIQWSDKPGYWSDPRPLWLGNSGETEPVLTLRSLGSYRRRNWRFTFSTDEKLALVNVEEEFEAAAE